MAATALIVATWSSSAIAGDQGRNAKTQVAAGYVTGDEKRPYGNDW